MADSKGPIKYDDFAKLDLRVGKVVECSEHPNADKLLVMQVDLGGERRQLVAGLKGHYQPDDMVGKQIIVVANLEPRVMRGLESQGMLLAAVEEANGSGPRVVVLTPSADVRPGSPCS